MAFTKNLEFFSYDAYPNGLVKISSILKHLQQLAREDLDNRGITYPMMRNDGMVFVLIKMHLNIKRRIGIYEKLSAKTIPTKIFGIYFYRDFFIYDENNELVAEATSSWVLIDFNSRKPLRPNAIPYTIVHCDDVCADLQLNRTFVFGDVLSSNNRTVLLSDMDENRHLNNAIISDFVLDELADEIFLNDRYVKDIEIHFHKEAPFNSRLVLRKHSSDNDFVIEAVFSDSNETAFVSKVSMF